MDYLLDTNALIRVLYRKEELSKEAIEVITDPSNQIFVSTLSLWEIEIKHLKRPDLIPFSSKEVAELLANTSAELLPLSVNHIYQLKNVYSELNHDPFDNVLAATALEEKMIFVTSDKKIGQYPQISVLMY